MGQLHKELLGWQRPVGAHLNTVVLGVDGAATKAFEKADLASSLVVAGAISATGEISMGADGDEITGIVLSVADQYAIENSQNVPESGVLALDGVHVVHYNTDTAPGIAERVVADGAGKVKQAPAEGTAATYSAGAVREARWIVLEKDTTNELVLIAKM